MQDKHVLITNLHAVRYQGVTFTDVSAMVLSSDHTGLERGRPHVMVRGFGPDPAWQVFDTRPDSIEYELEDSTPREHIEMEGFWKNGHRLYSSTKMTLASGLELELFHEDSEFELDVEVFEGSREEQTILLVWDVFVRRVARYWQAPGFPDLGVCSVESARESARLGYRHGALQRRIV